MTSVEQLKTLLHKECLLLGRNLNTLLLPPSLVILLAVMQPLSLGADNALLQRLAAGTTGTAVLLAVLLAAEKCFKSDYEDGTLRQYAISGASLLTVVWAKFLLHWGALLLPLLVALPLLGLFYALPPSVCLQMALTLLIASPSLVLLAMLGAVLTLPMSRGGLLAVIVILPLYLPLLIFAVSAVNAYADGFEHFGQLALLGAFLCLAVTLLPFVITAALHAVLVQA